MRTPAQSRSASSADRMLEATKTLLEQGGLTAATVAAVARAARTSNGSLYHRFGDRAGLLLATQRRAYDEVVGETVAALTHAEQALAGGADATDTVTGLAGTALAIFARHHGTLRTFLVEMNGQPEFDRATEGFLHTLSTTVTRWLRDQLDADPQDAEAAWRVLFAIGAAQGLFDDGQVSPTAVDPARFTAAVARAVLAVVLRTA